jgi:predicted secreted protein
MTIGQRRGARRAGWASGVALAISIGLAACATPEERERRIDTGGHVVTLTPGSASALEMRRDQELRIRLTVEPNNNREWTLVEIDAAVLAQQGARTFERKDLVSNFSEAAGADVFRFKPVGPGTTTLKFDYRRPRDLEPATQSLSYTVTVK